MRTRVVLGHLCILLYLHFGWWWGWPELQQFQGESNLHLDCQKLFWQLKIVTSAKGANATLCAFF